MLDGMNASTRRSTPTVPRRRRSHSSRGARRRRPRWAPDVVTDDQLAKSGTVFTDAPLMTAEQLVTRGLINHIDEHVGSIRKAVGH